MKNQKGQMTIFIILAIVIVASIALFFVFRDSIKFKMMSAEAESVYLFVEECINEVGVKVVYDVGAGGGYYFAPNFSTETDIPYYYSNGKNYMPSKIKIENEISYFVNEKLFFCTRNFVDFTNFEVSQGEIKTDIRIMGDKVVLNVDYPLKITKGKSTSVLGEFKIEIPVRFGVVYDSVAEIIKEQLNDEGICLSCILDVSLENDLYFDMIDYDDETVIFIVRDENSNVNDVLFEFVFANRYEVK